MLRLLLNAVLPELHRFANLTQAVINMKKRIRVQGLGCVRVKVWALPTAEWVRLGLGSVFADGDRHREREKDEGNDPLPREE
jgi:hypothetical protein